MLGGTSLIGRFLLPRLVHEGAEVVSLSRAPPIASVGDLRWIKADLERPEQIAHLPTADAIVSMTPIWRLAPVLATLTETGAKQLVAFSSTSRLTKIHSTVAEERDIAHKLADGEAATVAGCEAKGVAWTILRPTLIYAEGQDRNISRLAGVIRRFGVVPLSGSGAGLRQPVHADDLAWAAQAVLDQQRTWGQIYALPGGETLSYREMVERLFQGMSRTPRILYVPPRLWTLALGLASPLLPGATGAMGDRMSQDLVFDPAPAQRDFGWSPRPFRPRFVR